VLHHARSIPEIHLGSPTTNSVDGHLGRESGEAMKRIKNDPPNRDCKLTEDELRQVSGGGSEGGNGGGAGNDGKLLLAGSSDNGGGGASEKI
jgi:bacteriocin-like protein